MDETSKNNNDLKILLWPLIGLALFILGFYIIFDYTRKVKNFELNPDKIYFGNEIYLATDILNVIFFDKAFLINFKELNRPATTIKFKNKRAITIYDFGYSNIQELKTYIQNIYLGQNLKMHQNNLEYETERIENVVIHKGNLFTTSDFIFLLAFQVFFGWLLFKSIKDSKTEIWFILSFLWLYITYHFSKMLYYFETTNSQLIVKSHIFFWVNKRYLLNDIQNVSYENYYRRPQALKIVTNNFITNEFYGGSLNSKNWNSLTKVFKQANIKVS